MIKQKLVVIHYSRRGMGHDDVHESVCRSRNNSGFVFGVAFPIYQQGGFVNTGKDSANRGEEYFQKLHNLIIARQQGCAMQ